MSMNRAAVVGILCAALLPVAARAQMSPEKTVESFKLAAGLEATDWASEPDMVNPTNIDIDERGRIWVTEAANYRAFKTRDEGDRILILEDTHHTGRCDNYKVFVQDKRLFAPLGICKLGNKLYIAQSPNVLVYTIDESGDHPAGEPQVLFTGFGGVNHDHGVHAAVFGPDGRLYFNCGNEGGKAVIKYGDGKPVIDITGSEVGSRARIYHGKPKPRGFAGPREGFAFSCNPDGSEFETYAYNFRNNYELCVDSFGTVWQSDNDDDGNQGCTINYVMEGGNFGFTGPNGSNWGRDERQYKDVFKGQTHQEAQWHQRWPGVVPNLLNTGAGAPCGIVFYEGDLLGDTYRGTLLLADAGPNVVRAFFLQPGTACPPDISKPVSIEDASNWVKQGGGTGAGYEAREVEVVDGRRDRWFRPDDVCVAPDGAVYIADWYDPGVGGHGTGDTGAHEHNWRTLHGRIYRLAPTGYTPSVAKLDLSTPAGQLAALQSPNLATRYLGYTRLVAGGAGAQELLTGVFHTATNPYFRARALWLLARMVNGQQAVRQALKDKDPDIRVTAIRAARRIRMDMVTLANQMLGDSSPAVLRELCLAMAFEPDDRALPVLVRLADKYDGLDRWYLEALGIGATGREPRLLETWRKDHQNKNPATEEGIVWRLEMKPVPLGRSAQTAINTQKLVETVASAPAIASNAPALMTKDGNVLPPVSTLAGLRGDPQSGAKVFRNAGAANCIRCHQIGTDGGIVGPPLTTIGQKLNKAQLYDAILHPSAQILMGYETWVVRTKSAEILTGRKVEDTDDHITLLDVDGKYHDVSPDQIDKKVKQTVSLMPEGLCQSMSRQELVDLVEYLSRLK